MRIVEFEADMQRQVSDFFEKCFAAVDLPYSPDGRHSDLDDIEKNYMQCGRFWCMFEGESLVGTVAIRVFDVDAKTVELKRFFVLPERQGRGLGKKLLEYAVNYSRRQQYKKIYLDTRKDFAAARHLYQSAGFKETARYHDNGKADLYFELPL